MSVAYPALQLGFLRELPDYVRHAMSWSVLCPSNVLRNDAVEAKRALLPPIVAHPSWG